MDRFFPAVTVPNKNDLPKMPAGWRTSNLNPQRSCRTLSSQDKQPAARGCLLFFVPGIIHGVWVVIR